MRSRLVVILTLAVGFSASLVAIAAAVVGCTSTDSTTSGDFSIGTPGCRAPRACYSLNCNCVDSASLAACTLCDPRTAPGGSCDCNAYQDSGVTVMCLEAAQVCVGRAKTSCPGSGARCLPKGSSCASSGGVPPQLVSANVDGGPPSLEPRCALGEDVCCPGELPDNGVPEDMTPAPDLSEVDL